MFIYMDNSATTKQHSEVTKVMLQYMEQDFGNPSSLYGLGITAEKAVKTARKKVAAALGVDNDSIFFTSGGTEADNTAILGTAEARKRRGKRIITTEVEHPAILEACKRLEGRGFDVVYIGVDSNCLIDMEALQGSLTEDTLLVSVMTVNNETGTIMPLDKISAMIKAFNKEKNTDILLHSDMVQAFGKVKINPDWLDLASVSAHKIHGPKGCGAIYVRKGLRIEPFLVGGGQENHFRSGTENVPAIAGFGKAAEMSAADFSHRMKNISELRAYFLSQVKERISDIKINGYEHTALDCSGGACPAVLNISFLKTRGEVLLHTLENEGIYVSTGSACSSNKKGKSHVLTAMSLKEKEIEGAIRFSFSGYNTKEDIDYTLDKLQESVARIRKLGSFR